MKASELIKVLQAHIDIFGDRHVKIVGAFEHGIFDKFAISPSEDYLDECIFDPNKKYPIKNTFLIDRED